MINEDLTPNLIMQLRRWLRYCVISNILLFTFLCGLDLSAQEPLQAYVTSLMRGRHGAVIVTNPESGQVLAVWNPLEAFDKSYPPGSTAKLVTSTAALEESLISPNEQTFCHRIPELLGDAYHCSHPYADAPYTLASALSNSCNYFFSALSLRLTSAQLAHWYAVFGFGSPVDGVGSMASIGQVRVGDDPKEKALAALGEGTILVTPAQLLQAYSAVANRGIVYRLWQSGSNEKRTPLVSRRINLRPRTVDLLSSALTNCVQSGTAQAAAVPGILVAGKTGTATAIDGNGVTHAWFVGYAPSDEPKIAIVVFLERGTGARDAAPVAGKILRNYFVTQGQK